MKTNTRQKVLNAIGISGVVLGLLGIILAILKIIGVF